MTLKFMIDTLAGLQPGERISPVEWVKKYDEVRRFDAATEIAHLEALIAYLLHPPCPQRTLWYRLFKVKWNN